MALPSMKLRLVSTKLSELLPQSREAALRKDNLFFLMCMVRFDAFGMHWLGSGDASANDVNPGSPTPCWGDNGPLVWHVLYAS